MKRALAVLILFIAPALFAQNDRAILLAPNGTLYTIESKTTDSASTDIQSMRYLQLTIQNGANVIKTNVPASLTGGSNWQPALAFDDGSASLFVLWLHSPNTIFATNELLFCSFQNGKWNEPSSVEDAPFHLRYNLRVGVTRTIEITDEKTGDPKQTPALTVHAAWWDESGTGESARYAMLSVDKGVVTDVYQRDLMDFINTADLKIFDLDDASKEILRHPVVSESAAHDTVDVVFGDTVTNSLHRLTLKPVLQTRVRIPIGVRDTTYPAPRIHIGADSTVSTMSTTPDRLVFYYRAAGELRYMLFDGGTWSDEKSITLTNEVSAETAIAALRRMVSGD